MEPSDQRWVDYAAAMPAANIFHHPAWISLVADCYGYRPFILALTDRDGRIRAGLPITEVRSLLTGRRWVSLPFTDYCPPLCRDEDALRDLTDVLIDLHRSDRVPRTEVRWKLDDVEPLHFDSHYVLQTTDLCPDPDGLYDQFSHTTRKNIKRAKKREVCIRRGEKLEDIRLFYQLHTETRRRHGVPVQPWRYFRMLHERIVRPGLGFVLLAHKGGTCWAGAVFLHWGDTLTCKYSASLEDTERLRCNNLVFWTAMRWGCENGYAVFDMGRSNVENEGLRRYKRGWAASETPLTYSILSSGEGRPTDGALMSAMEAVVRRSPEWVCRVAGELLYRHVG
jgi:hypothetical protein